MKLLWIEDFDFKLISTGDDYSEKLRIHGIFKMAPTKTVGKPKIGISVTQLQVGMDLQYKSLIIWFWMLEFLMN